MQSSLVLDARFVLAQVDRRLLGARRPGQGARPHNGEFAVALPPGSWDVLRLSHAPGT